MPKSALQHDMAAELRYQLYQTALSMSEALGSWESIVIAEQYETICRFLDHPHAVPEPLPLRPEQLVRGRRTL